MPLRKERVLDVVHALSRAYPKARIALEFSNPFELLVATILSAQSTDARVNMVTKELFAKYPDAKTLAAADPRVLEQDIHSTGFYKQKAKSLLAMAKALVEKHGGEVPRTMEELVELPGVGRKTANVVLTNACDVTVGIVVDTHVSRLAGRLGFTRESDATKIEADLMKVFPRNEWGKLANRMILHGRNICVARKPKCGECVLNALCPSAQEPPE